MLLGRDEEIIMKKWNDMQACLCFHFNNDEWIPSK